MIELPATPLPRREWIACCRPAGRRGYPPELVAAMHADYMAMGSLRHAAAVWGITNQAFHDIMRRRGLQRRKVRKPTVEFLGERFAQDHQGYYRSTSFASRQRGGHRLLHRVVWEHFKGPIPEGHMVAFRDGNRTNCAIENLKCLSKHQTPELRKEHSNGFTTYEKKVAPLREAYFRTIHESSDHEEIERARLAYESVPRPTNGPTELRRAQCKAIWDSYTPEQRAARVAKAVSARHPKSQTETP